MKAVVITYTVLSKNHVQINSITGDLMLEDLKNRIPVTAQPLGITSVYGINTLVLIYYNRQLRDRLWDGKIVTMDYFKWFIEAFEFVGYITQEILSPTWEGRAKLDFPLLGLKETPRRILIDGIRGYDWGNSKEQLRDICNRYSKLASKKLDMYETESHQVGIEITNGRIDIFNSFKEHEIKHYIRRNRNLPLITREYYDGMIHLHLHYGGQMWVFDCGDKLPRNVQWILQSAVEHTRRLTPYIYKLKPKETKTFSITLDV